ncbi:hypothetical protein J437_LFUL011206 [Ladona fulva]|uniref:5'-nucleotidase n=1 Tax=Ladona fulva TaxID=123851 RepID=A0A8K0P8L1_LADFU|nr:hypothetical protein J437_LFUL011206 [Ladona fulva]
MRKKNIKLHDVDYLQNEKVRMKDRDKVEELINILVSGGKERLQVISDFDMTLTKQHENGNRCITSFGIFEFSHHLPPNYREKSRALFNKYYPIEVCHQMSVEDKIPHMIEWYKEAEKLLQGCHLTPEDIVEAVNETHTILRDGTEKMFETLEAAGIPVLVLSAGVGDVVAAVLRKHSVNQQNLTIVSNFLEFSQKGKVTILEGFKGECIHVFNKHTAGSGPNSHGE